MFCSTFKKLLALLLTLTVLLAVFAACATEEPMESTGEVSDFSSEKHFDINDILQNGDESEEESTSVGSSAGAESTDEPSVSSDESSAGTTSEPVSQEQSGDETPPEESTASKPEESHGTSSNQSTESTNTPSQGTMSQPSESSQGTTSKPAETSQGTTSNPSQGTTSQPSGGQLNGELVVSDKKYTYKSENLMLLHVENKTALHLDITIKGKYLDKSGKVIKEETQTYRAFPSGWSNYFIFRPKGTFDSFDYTIQVKEFKSTTKEDKLYAHNGEPLSTYISLTYDKNLVWERGVRGMRDLMMDMELINRHPSVTIGTEFHVLILDAQGNIYAMDYEYFDGWDTPVETLLSGTTADPIGGTDDGKAKVALRAQAEGEDETIPANIQGKITAIFAVVQVYDFNEVRNQLW